MTEYQEKFEKISCRSKLTEEQKLDCYLGGLKDELAWDVRLFNPSTVLEAARLTKIKEMSLQSTSKTGVMVAEFRKGNLNVARTQEAQQPSDERGVLGKPSYRFQTKMTTTELEEHRVKNICFFCHERFTPGHSCPQSQKMQVFFMEVIDT